MITKRILSPCVHALVFTLLALPAFAADFYAIVDDFGRRPRNAYVDIAVDSTSGGNAPPEVLFNLFDFQGSQIAEFFLPSNVNGFVSTASFGNLFDLTTGRPMLVHARTPSTAADFGAALHIDSVGAPMTIGILHKSKADGTSFGMGTVFSVPLGSFRSAYLLIANVSGSDVGVELFRGALGAAGTGNPSNQRLTSHAIWKLALTANEAFANVIVRSTGFIIVQVVVDDGRSIQSYMVPPTS